MLLGQDLEVTDGTDHNSNKLASSELPQLERLRERVSTVYSSDPEKAELAGTPIIQKRVVSLLVETELQTRARWKGY
jgi:hypothetical protein